MLNHVSIGVENPGKVAAVVAEIWHGKVLPFPPCPNSFIVFADDGRGSLLEVMPLDAVIVPGEGLPPEDNFDSATPTEQHEGQFVTSGFSPRYVATHVNISSHLSEAEIKAIGAREGWRTLTCNRAGGFFQLIEIWLENRLMIEVMTPEMTERYLEVTNPQVFAAMLQAPLPLVVTSSMELPFSQ